MSHASEQSGINAESTGESWRAGHSELEPVTQGGDLVRNRLVLCFVLLAFLFATAFAVRIHYLGSSRIVGEVQFRQALIARGYFYKMKDSIPDWRREANADSLQNLHDREKEPSIMEFIVALGYRLLGEEDLRLPRLLASVFWLVGGVFLYRIARRVTSRDAAVVSTAYYLFVPLGVVVSTSFQPDSLMTMMYVISIYAILRYDEQPSRIRLMVAAGVSALAMLVKPLVLSTISCAFISLAIYRKGSLKRVIDSRLVIFFVLSLLPTGLYYGRGILTGGSLSQQAQVSFLPQLWLTRGYWRGWMLTATDAVGLAPLVAALLGITVSRSGALRALLIGLWGGYAVFCLAFTYHIRYASYYHLQLVPVVALSCAPLSCVFLRYVRRRSIGWYWFLPALGALLLAGLFTFREIRGTLSSCPAIEGAEVAKRIGDIINHSNKAVYIASYYGRPLEYYGELSGAYWPRSISDTDRALGRSGLELTVEERLSSFGFAPEYFVITDFYEFQRNHADL